MQNQTLTIGSPVKKLRGRPRVADENTPYDTPSVHMPTLCRWLDLEQSYVYKLITKGVLPRQLADGLFDLPLTNTMYIRYLRDRVKGTTEGSLVEEKTKLARAQTEKIEVETARMRGELVSLEDVKIEWGSMVTACRAKLLTIAVRAAPMVASCKNENTAEKIINDMVLEALDELVADATEEEQPNT